MFYWILFFLFISLCGCSAPASLDAIEKADAVLITYFENETQYEAVHVTQEEYLLRLTELLTDMEYEPTSAPMEFPRLEVTFYKGSEQIEIFCFDKNQNVSSAAFGKGNQHLTGPSPYAEIDMLYHTLSD